MHYDMKLVVSDIDDTLLPKGGVISQGTRRAVAECRRQGDCVFPGQRAVVSFHGDRGGDAGGQRAADRGQRRLRNGPWTGKC